MRQPHRGDTHPLGPAHPFVDVERHRLVLGLLERVPHQQVAHALVTDLVPGLRVCEQRLSEGGRVVLECGGEGQVAPLTREALT